MPKNQPGTEQPLLRRKEYSMQWPIWKMPVVTQGTHQPPSETDGTSTNTYTIYSMAVHVSHYQDLQELISNGATETDLQAVAFRWVIAATAGTHKHT